ncbi:Protein of unknown function [Gryllus bimaculatus]|nr:Protein of unknown function [Gryllus bimaculatus]
MKNTPTYCPWLSLSEWSHRRRRHREWRKRWQPPNGGHGRATAVTGARGGGPRVASAGALHSQPKAPPHCAPRGESVGRNGFGFSSQFTNCI